ncbi:MAG TPA: polysaccharide biosynthesis/export family protein [Psychromonas sp.]
MMKKFIKFFSLIICFIYPLQSIAYTDYILDTGDEIRIVVYDEPDLTVRLFISDDGYINFPFIGIVFVTGKTTVEVQNIIHNGLKGDYLLNPSVQVDVVTYRPFFIHGEVKKPGAYPYKPGLTINQAVVLGGGFTERASTSKIYIKTGKNSGSSRKNVSLSDSVSPGDTITVEQSFF